MPGHVNVPTYSLASVVNDNFLRVAWDAGCQRLLQCDTVTKTCNFKLFQWQRRNSESMKWRAVTHLSLRRAPRPHVSTKRTHEHTHTHVGKRTIRTPSPTICLIERDVSWEDLLKCATVQRWVCSFSQFKSAKRCTWLHKRCAARCHDNTPGKTPSLYCYAASVGCLWNVHSYLWPFERQVTANLGQNAPHSLVVNVLLWHAWRDILI